MIMHIFHIAIAQLYVSRMRCTHGCRPKAAVMAVAAITSAAAVLTSVAESMSKAVSQDQIKAFIEVMTAALHTLQDANIILSYVGNPDDLQRQLQNLR